VDIHDKKQIVQTDSGKGGWISGYGLEAPVDDPLFGYVHVYVADTPQKARAARQAEHSQKIAEFGRLLGYPPCCVDFYLRRLDTAEQDQGDFVLPLLEASLEDRLGKKPSFPHWLNVAAQYFSASLISFYPCSFFCEKAIAVAENSLTLMRNYDEAWAAATLEVCKTPVLYTEYEGIYMFRNAVWLDNALHYSPKAIESSLNGVIASLLAQGDRLTLFSPHDITIWCVDERIARLQSHNLAMLVFT
jgi:hypothetical protein